MEKDNKVGKGPIRPFSFEEVKSFFESIGYTLLSTEYKNAHTKLEYICNVGHESSGKFMNFRQGSRCGKCRGNRIAQKALTPFKELKEFIESQKYQLLSTEYINPDKKLEVICPNGHIYLVKWTNFYHCKNRCTKCRSQEAYTRAEKLFLKEGYTLLSKEYLGKRSYADFICPNGHKGSISWRSFQEGRRCSKCFAHRMTLKRGKSHPLYKGGKLARNYSDYTEWRRNVLKRDNARCVLCTSEEKLNAHHLYSYSDHPNLRIDVDNGVALCSRCHVDFHSLYGKGKNTKEQFEKFKHYKKFSLYSIMMKLTQN